jgi:hypothetical protein
VYTPSAPRTSFASSSPGASVTAAASRAAEATERRELHRAPAATDRRLTGFTAKAADGLRARLGWHQLGGRGDPLHHGRGQTAHAGQAAGGGHLGHPLHHLVGRQLAVAAHPKHARENPLAARLQLRGGGQHHRVAERAGETGLAAVGQRVAANVQENREIDLHPPDGGGDAVGDLRRTAVRVHEQGGSA